MTDKNFKISIIAPVFNEASNIDAFIKEVVKNCLSFDFELILVNDGSVDDTSAKIVSASRENANIKMLSFARNFGHQSAIKAGIDHAAGDAIIMLDADLQHPPEQIPIMVKWWKEGYKIVQGIRTYKDERMLKKLTSSLFYRIINQLSELELKAGSADFRLIDRVVAEQIKANNEYHLFLRGLFSWYGYTTKYLPYTANSRMSGETKFSFLKMFNLSLSGVTGFSIKPLRLSIFIGCLFTLISMIYLGYALYMKLFTDATVDGWTSTIIVITLIGGIQLTLLGIIGEYIGKIFQQLKNRPQYIIDQKIGFDE
ncbi:MAG: glycosyltransferase family 2 protein [Bacteroidota bacterium]